MLVGGPVRERAETSIQAVILVPVVFLVVFMCFHMAALIHQSHVAMAIAVRGTEISASSIEHATARHRAVSEMNLMAAELGVALADTPRISYHSNAVRVDVSLRVSGAVPFLPRVASASARQTLERFVLEQDRE
jgi:hypothetical protein